MDSLERFVSKIDDITLDSLAKEKFCPAGCTIRQTGPSEKATEFSISRPKMPEILQHLWKTVGKFLWRWRMLNAVVTGAISSLVMVACLIRHLVRTSVCNLDRSSN
jgi:hypothetical protein